MVLFMALAWYCDHVISHNRGVAYPPYFVFTKAYWKSIFIKKSDKKIKKKKNKKNKKRNIGEIMNDYKEEED